MIHYDQVLLDFVVTELCLNLAKHSAGDEIIRLETWRDENEKWWAGIAVSDTPKTDAIPPGCKLVTGLGFASLLHGIQLYGLPKPDYTTSATCFHALVPIGSLVPGVAG
jgi:hypothetical protein